MYVERNSNKELSKALARMKETGKASSPPGNKKQKNRVRKKPNLTQPNIWNGKKRKIARKVWLHLYRKEIQTLKAAKQKREKERKKP